MVVSCMKQTSLLAKARKGSLTLKLAWSRVAGLDCLVVVVVVVVDVVVVVVAVVGIVLFVLVLAFRTRLLSCIQFGLPLSILVESNQGLNTHL